MSFDDPDWASLQASYGPAKDVPALLHRLNSPSRTERSTAITDLRGCLCHQGTVYEASAVAAPLLLDAAQRPNLSSEERTQLLALVVHIGLVRIRRGRGTPLGRSSRTALGRWKHCFPSLQNWHLKG